MWNYHTPCALQAKESWDLWINIETRERKADILLDDLKLCCRPGLIEDNSFNSQQYFLESFVLDILLEDSKATSPPDQYILPDLPIGLPFDEIKGWINLCMDRAEGHEGCHRQEPTLPTRVVDVTTNPPKVILSHGRTEPYIALSHCWGGPIRTRLLHENKAKFINDGISEDILPPTFKDATFVTRRLGFQYLWIDALCIVQDDDKDWEREALLMCQVYERASLVLSAYSTSSSEAGFHIRRSARIASNEHGILYAQRSMISEFDTDQPLRDRGWTLQEHALAFSILNIGRGMVNFVCPGGCYVEGSGGNLQPNGRRGDLNVTMPKESLFQVTYRQPPTQDDFWRWIVQDYSSRNLTFAEDKLAAISGIAEKFETGVPTFKSSFTQKSYIVGLWRETLLNDLMWATTPEATVVSCPNRAPSWSWIGWDGAVDWRFLQHFEGAMNFQTHCSIDTPAVWVSDDKKAARRVSGELVISGLLVHVSSCGLRRLSISGDSSLDRSNNLDDCLLAVFEGAKGATSRRFRDILGIVDRDTDESCWALRLYGGYTCHLVEISTAFMLLEKVHHDSGKEAMNTFRRIGLIVVRTNLTYLLFEGETRPTIASEDDIDPYGWPGEVRRITII